jgi:NADPH-dependent 2,4-dienoyl-CoA reductase/sulfur reductase-like enzyme/nitrite reductase/ring-hydroxylating ferredoxin subunit
MGGDDQPTGPDLRAGIAESDLADGGMLAGRVGDDAVLLARRGEEIFAIGGKCTHYGGPLAQGLLVHNTVRCPWHHACFDLRTGEALRAPALNDVPRYIVERRAGRIVVGEKVEPDRAARAARSTPSQAPESVVIVGAGAAGNAAAEMLRREGYRGPITMIDDDSDAPYDRPNLSKDYLAGTAPEEWIPLHPPDFYEAQDIRIVRAAVASIDPEARTVKAGDESIPYGALLLATGAEPVRPDIPVSDGARVFTLRSLADSRAIIGAAGNARRVVVVGASFIGLEVAASLRNRAVEVDVVAPERVPLEKVMGPQLGAHIRALHESKGVRFHLERKPARIEADAVVLDDGTRLVCDFVVLGVGVRPRTALAESIGAKVDNGVFVDERLATSVPAVWAAGDIARWPDPITGDRIRVEHWVLAERHGQAAARSMLGKLDRFGEAPFFWSQHYDVVIAYVGHAVEWDDIGVDGDPGENDCTVTFRRGGRRLAIATIFRDEESLRAEVEMER